MIRGPLEGSVHVVCCVEPTWLNGFCSIVPVPAPAPAPAPAPVPAPEAPASFKAVSWSIAK